MLKASVGEVLGNEVESEELIDGEEEAQVAATLPTPYMPTQSERDDHELTHAQYRSWCEHCVNGRGIEMAHKLGVDHEERSVALVGFDYMFLTASNLFKRRVG